MITNNPALKIGAAGAAPGISFDGIANIRSNSGVNLGVVALVAMFLSTFMWGIAPDAPLPPMGNNRNYYRMVLVMFSGAASVFVLLRNPRAWPLAFPGPLILLLLYGILAMISSIFVPEYAFYALWKSMEVVVLVLAAAAILSYPVETQNERATYHAIVVLNAILVVVFAVEALLMPERAVHPARGLLPFKISGVVPVTPENALAFLSALTAFAMFVRLFRPARWWAKLLGALLFVLSLVVLVLAQSRTSLVGLCFAIVLYSFMDRRFGLLAGLVVLIALAGVYASFFDVFTQYILRGQDAQLVRSFSGRTDAWAEGWVQFQNAPFLGHGFAAFARASIMGLGGMTSMHGAVLEVIVGTGAFGLMAWGGGVVWALLRLYRLPSSGDPWFGTAIGRSIQAEMVGLVAIILPRAATSSGLAEAEDNLMLFLAVVVYTEFRRRMARRLNTAPAVAGYA